MVMRYGMVKALGDVAYEEERSPFLGRHARCRGRASTARQTAREIDVAVRDIVRAAHDKALAVLQRDKALLERGAKLLLEKETLAEAELAALKPQQPRRGAGMKPAPAPGGAGGPGRLRKHLPEGARPPSMSLRSLPLGEVYRLLEPGPVVLVTTARAGRANVMAMSWHTMMEFEPPLVGCVLSASHHTLRCVSWRRASACIAIPTVEIAAKVVGCGNTSGRKVDKFARFGLTPLPASRVRAPLVAECYANLECRLADAQPGAQVQLPRAARGESLDRPGAQAAAHPASHGPRRVHGRRAARCGCPPG